MTEKNVTRREFVKKSSAAGAGFLAPAMLASAKAKSKPALLGGEPAVQTAFPPWPMIERLDEDKFLYTLRSTRWCRLGVKVTNTFEEEWAERNGAKYSTTTVNGTNALYAALSVLDVGPGDEVIVPVFTFVATINAVIQQFALPVFADTDIDTFQVDPDSIEKKITKNTRAIMPVHMGGGMANMDAIMKIAKKHKLPVIEDACQAHFAEWDGRKAGSIGDIGCFSFQETKILPCGEGGACITSSETLQDKLQSFCNNGRDDKRGHSKGYLHQGSNLRMMEYQSALLLAQLTRLEDQCKHRVGNALYLDQLLGDIPGIRPAGVYKPNNRNTHYLYMMHYDKKQFDGLPRERFLRALNKEGVGCGNGYSRLNEHPFITKTLNSRGYKNIYSEKRLEKYFDENKCPVNDQLAEEGLFMGQRCLIGTRENIEQIAEAILKIKTHASALKA